MNNYNYYQNAYMGYPQNGAMQPYQQRQYQPQQPFVQQTQQVQIPIVDIRFVNEKEVADFIVFPNTSVLLIDKENLSAYLKTANANAQPSIKKFTYSELDGEGKPLNGSKTPQTKELEQFIKKDEIGSLGLVSMSYYEQQYNKLVEGFNAKIKSLQEKIMGVNNGKPNSTENT